VAGIQHDIAWEDRDATLARVGPMVDAAAGAGARLVLLTEMFAVGFTMATAAVAEGPEGPTTAWLVDRAAATGAWVGGSVPVRVDGDDRPANTFTLAAPDGAVHRYRKRHPFSYAGEDAHYAPGAEDVTVDVDGVRVTPTVCYDLRFADQYWRQATATDLYVVVANWPAPRVTHWRALLVARAIENQAYVLGVNRVGADGNGLDHVGGSCLVDPMGQLVADAGLGSTEQTIAGDVDPARVAEVRATLPFLQDRSRSPATPSR
jgi:predicted amidohydrolase